VPIYTSHTILSANGKEQVESVTIAQIDEDFQPITGTERSFDCDTVLIAVGLDPVNEFTLKADAFGMDVFAAGDAEEIAEASSAMFSGKIKGREIARFLGAEDSAIPSDWYRTADILKSHPGEVEERLQPSEQRGVMPIFHCSQEIPCNPCTSVCPQGLIHIDEEDIRKLPEFLGPYTSKECIGCERCVTICPGLAITLVDTRKDEEDAIVTLAHEYLPESIHAGDMVTVLDVDGHILGQLPVESVRSIQRNDHTLVVKLRSPKAIARQIAGIQVQQPWVSAPLPETIERLLDDSIVCRCEHVTAGEVRKLIREGYRDLNLIKNITRAGMGACGGKTCSSLLLRLFREEGIALDEVTTQVKRPLFIEVPLGVFAGNKEEPA
jgi:Fe-S-cluster-containing hydrogenase component 2